MQLNKDGVLRVRIIKKEGEKKKTTLSLEWVKEGRGWVGVEKKSIVPALYLSRGM